MSKADHMLSILWMLRQRKRTAAELAQELELSVRSVYRYIDALCQSGVPVIADAGPGGGYSLPEHTGAAPLFFDEEERRALVQASAFARGSGYPYEEALDRAIVKLRRYSNEAQLAQLERHEEGLEIVHSPGTDLSRLLGELEVCAAEGHTLEMDYRKGNGGDGTFSVRTIDPYGLVLWKGQWYMAGFCHLRGEIRSFRVDRMVGLRRTGAEFSRPNGFSARDFLLKGLLPDQQDSSRLITLVIAAPEGVLNDLCSHWVFGHALKGRSEGQAMFELDETALNRYAPYYLLPYGKTLNIIGPAAFRQRLADVAGELAAHYSESSAAPNH